MFIDLGEREQEERERDYLPYVPQAGIEPTT